ncbi:prepilin-type cleavage/methylation domain-containing protein [Legionella septentrionalis]|uniref:prepilin-type cleavage/methylation domain-containing protein n=1 Tax=Legionella septentrionalis TaxID=2498109 RepID=UPI000F8D8C3B|nr:prepilin-type cleavage/methylation domain-containing protein [Legionella septentrionalis]RUQ96866.1 prepilin-type cleavage/methylation domain-containing protein [Legionella septentrionalis]
MNGFSLTEVLISLFLLTTIALALLKQQWQIQQLFNQLHWRAQALIELDNLSEQLLAYQQPTPLPGKPFQFTKKMLSDTQRLYLQWQDPIEAKAFSLQRDLSLQ